MTRPKELPGGNIPRINLLDIPVDAFTIDTLHQCMAELIRHDKKAIIANVNINAMNIAYEQDWYADFLRSSEYVFCDGHGIMAAAKMIGQQLPQKITYAHWVPLLASFCEKNQFSIFLLGAKPGIADKAAATLRKSCPDLNIAGTHHGHFDHRIEAEENRAVCTLINNVRPDILLVSMGMPVQEQWLLHNWDGVNARIALCGGAALDYVSGDLKRPPAWMTDHGLEWLGRMIIEPRRLWKRYVLGNPLFYWRVLSWRLRAARRI